MAWLQCGAGLQRVLQEVGRRVLEAQGEPYALPLSPSSPCSSLPFVILFLALPSSPFPSPLSLIPLFSHSLFPHSRFSFLFPPFLFPLSPSPYPLFPISLSPSLSPFPFPRPPFPHSSVPHSLFLYPPFPLPFPLFPFPPFLFSSSPFHSPFPPSLPSLRPGRGCGSCGRRRPSSAGMTGTGPRRSWTR